MENCTFKPYRGSERVVHFQQSELKHIFINFHEHRPGLDFEFTDESIAKFVVEREDLIEDYKDDLTLLDSILKKKSWNVQDYFMEMSDKRRRSIHSELEKKLPKFEEKYAEKYADEIDALTAYQFDKSTVLKKKHPNLTVIRIDDTKLLLEHPLSLILTMGYLHQDKLLELLVQGCNKDILSKRD